MRFKKRFLRKIISVFASVLLLVNSFTPYLLITPNFSQVVAQEATATPTAEPTPADVISPTPTAEPTLVPTEAATPSPTAEPTAVPTEIPTPTITPTSTPEPTLEATPSVIPTVDLTPATKSESLSKSKIPLRTTGNFFKKINIERLSKSKRKLSTDLLRLIDNNFLPSGKNRTQLVSQMKKLKQFVAKDDSVKIIDKRIENKSHSDLVYVYVNLKESVQTSVIDSLAWKVTDRDETNHIAAVFIEVNKLDNLASLEAVRSIQSVMPPAVQSGSVITEGDIIHKSNLVRSTYSQSGAGIKVGVISDGVDSISSSISTADLPSDVTILSNSVGGDEGTAILEIIHDIVPSSKLYFHDSGSNVIEFNSAIDDLIASGANVIIDDMIWPTQPYFEDGTIAQHVESVLASKNIIYISSAGNYAENHYQGDYYEDESGSGYHDFSRSPTTDSYLYVNIPNNGTVAAVLQWNDRFGSSNNDYDLGLFNTNGWALLDSSLNTQNGSGDPMEIFSYTNITGSTIIGEIDISKYSGSTKTLELMIYSSGGATNYSDNITPADSIFGHQAVPSVIAVGAISASDPSNDTIEPFSSQGPVAIIGESQRIKPDIAGIDCIAVTGAGGFPSPFCGTSAAAPHIAAIAAQLWGRYPSATGTQIRDYILNNAVDLGSAGNDSIFGHGRADALASYSDLVASIPSSNKAISVFTIPSQVGETVINEGDHTIGVTMPFGTNVTALVPTITHTGSSISPASGIAGNFTSPKTYTVTAADSSTQAYTVTVTFSEDPVAAAFDVISANLAASPNFVANNLNDVTSANVSSFAGLSFEKSVSGIPVGKLSFSSPLNLSTTETRTFLENLGTKLEQGNGRIALDARESAVFSATGASLTMYGFTGDINQSQLIVRDDTDVVLNQIGLISSFAQDPITHNITFNTAHFTQFDIDITKPVIASHTNVGPIEATSASGAIATYTSPSTTDNIDETSPATCSPLSGTTFALGQTTITCNKTDTAGNSAVPTTFTVTVVDSTKPVIAAHTNITTLATSPSGASVTYTSPLATDNVDTTSAASCTPTSGSTFPIGVTTVTCTKTDAAGNNAISTTFTVTVNKNPPVLDAIGNKTVNELANLTFTANATDVDSTPTYSLTNAPTGATVDSSTGVFSFTPTEAQGPEIYTVTVSSSDDTSTDSEIITITVNEVNIAPVADDITTSTNEDTTKVISLTSTDADFPANTLSYVKITNPTHGTVSITGNQATYSPSANYNGSDSFTYKSNDELVDSAPATVTITVNTVNDTPAITSVAPTSAVEDTLYTYDASVSDVDGPSATWSVAPSDTCGGIITSDTGIYTFTPAGPTPPASCVISIEVTDSGTPDLSATQTSTISITAVNDSPVSGADSYSTNEDTTLNIAAPGVLTNDSDPDNVNITAVLVSDVLHGTLTLNSNGSFSYAPVANYNGLDSFTYKVNDGAANSLTATVSITITPVNDSPVAVANSYSANEDTVLNIDNTSLLANDTDIDGDNLTIQSVSNPLHGTVELDNFDPNGKKVIFTPTANFNGNASFDYTITDGTLTSTVTVTITYNPINDVPILAAIGNKSIDEFATLTTTVSATDVDNADLTYTTSALPANATFNVATKTLSFTPVESQGGSTFTVTFTVTDGDLSDSETITIVVNEVPNAPVAVNDDASVSEDSTLTFNTSTFLSNDYDLDTNTNAGLTVTAVNTAVNGTVSLTGSTITFTPTVNFYGSASFKYTVSDGSLIDTGTVNVTVNAVNDSPILEAIGNKNVDEFSTLSIIASATDIDNESLIYTISTLPANATFNATEKTFSFTPNESQGASSYDVTFTVSDGSLSDSETITIVVNEVPNAPVATADTATMNEDSVLTINTSTLLSNDIDLDTNTNIGLSISVVNTPVNGGVSISGNTITFTPNADFNGTASFKYVVSDGSLTDTGTVTVTVNTINDKPVADEQTVTTEEDNALLIALIGNDIDEDILTYSKTSDPSHGSVSFSENEVTYTPSANYNGSDSFTFKVNDGLLDSDTATVNITITTVNDSPALDQIGNKTIDELTNLTFTAHATDPDNTVSYSLTNAPTGATINSSTGFFSFTPTEAQGPESYILTVNAGDGTNTDSEEITITVNEVNVAPIANTISTSTNEDTEKIITLTATDSDLPENTLTFTTVADPSHGTVSILNDQATYTPSANYNGSDSFTYRANDGTANSNISTVTITVDVVNDSPVAVANSYSANEDTVLNIDNTSLLANDTDIDGDNLTIQSVSNPLHGTVELDNFDPNGKKVIFTPTANFNGNASFDYTVSDGTLVDSGTVTITYNPINDAPVCNNVVLTTGEDTQGSTEPVCSDVEGDNLTYEIVTQPSNGTASIGSLIYNPDLDFNGTDQFTYRAHDSLTEGNAAFVNVTVSAVNDRPEASNDDGFETDEDNSLQIATDELLSNDFDVDDAISITNISSPVNGTVDLDIENDNIIFIPTANYFGSASFDYTISDGTLTDAATVSITVNSINDIPMAANGSISTDENVAKIITFSATDIDLPVQTLIYSIVTTPLHGSLSTISGNQVTYTPNTHYSGTDSFTFKANDGTDNSNTATITIAINDISSPTVTKLGDGSSDFSLETGDTDLIFSEVLSINSKTAVENALTDGADKVLSYSWSGETLVITATQTTSFANDVMVNVSDVAGNTTNSLLIVDSSLTASQTTPDSDGEATADSDSPEVVITDPEDEVTVTVDGDTEATIDVSSFINEDGDGDIPKISINTDDAEIDIPATTVTGPDNWDGVIAAPTVTTIDLPVVSGETSTLGTAIEIGFSSDKLSFDNAVRILLPGQAGKRAGYSRPGTAFTEITSICSSDSQTAGDALGVDGECKKDVGLDLVIWTKHFTKFAAYTQTTNSTSTSSSTSSSSGTDTTSAPVCNDTKPGNAPVLLSAVAGLNSVTLNWTKANDPVSYYLVTFGTKPGEQLYGNPNVGGSNTTSYTISNLSGGKAYYFKVRAGNGCMPGDYSNEITGSPSGGFIAGVPEGFAAGVLGAQDQITPTGVPIGKVAPSLVPNSAGTSPRLGFFQRVWNFILGLFKR